MPPHYALSELVLVIAAGGCAWQFWRQRLFFAALGAVLLSLVALIGSLRFGLGLHAELGAAHKALSQLGGLAALTLLACDLARTTLSTGLQTPGRTFTGLGVAAVVLTALIWPPAAMPLILLFALILPVLVALRPFARPTWHLLAVLGASLFLVNALLIRRSPLLEPALSWHLSHLVMAVWIVSLAVSWRKAA